MSLLVDVARRTIGYHEKATPDLQYLFTNDLNNGDKDWNQYAYILDHIGEGLDQLFFNTPKFNEGYDWCSIWVHYIVYEALGRDAAAAYEFMHEPADHLQNTGAVVSYVKYFFQNSGKYHSRTSGYTPKEGDIILFYEQGDWQHIGIVSLVTNEKIRYIHGNSNYPSYSINVEGLSESEIRNAVRENEVPRGWSVIGGYGETDDSDLGTLHSRRFAKVTDSVSEKQKRRMR